MLIAVLYPDQNGCTLDAEAEGSYTMFLHIDHRSRVVTISPRPDAEVGLVPCHCEARYFVPDLPAGRYRELLDELAPMAELIIDRRNGGATPAELAAAAKQQIIRLVMDPKLWADSDAWIAGQLAG